MSNLLRAHVATSKVDLALADMATLEKAGGSGTGPAQLYFGLGKLLQKEMDRLKEKGDSAGLNRTQQTYQKFFDRAGREQVGPDLRVAPVGGREHAGAGQPQGGRRASSTASSRSTARTRRS